MPLSALKPSTADSDLNWSAQANPCRRRAERLDIDTDVVVRSVYGTTTVGVVTDVSTHGCQVDLKSGHLRIGQFVTIRIKGLEPWVGVVRHGDFKVYGIEFATALYGPVVEHLAIKNRVAQLQ